MLLCILRGFVGSLQAQNPQDLKGGAIVWLVTGSVLEFSTPDPHQPRVAYSYGHKASERTRTDGGWEFLATMANPTWQKIIH